MVSTTPASPSIRFNRSKSEGHTFAFSRQKCPSDASISRRRERRVFVAPAALRASEESTQASHHRYAETVRRIQTVVATPRFGGCDERSNPPSGAPCAMVYGLVRALPECRRSAGLDSLRRPPSLADLIPASGNLDHAALLVRAGFARLATPSRPSHPVSNVLWRLAIYFRI
jgi:hypothetical protein